MAANSLHLWGDLLASDRQKRMMPVMDTVRKECRYAKCSKPAGLLCSKCRAAAYCSDECQRADWKEAHQSLCFPFDIFSCVMREDIEGCTHLLHNNLTKRSKQVEDTMNYINEHKELSAEIAKAFEAFPVVLGELTRLSSIASDGIRKLQTDDMQTLHCILLKATSPCHNAVAMSVDKDRKPKDIKPIIHFVVATGNQAIVDLFLAHGARLDEKDSAGQTAFEALRDFEFTRSIQLSATLSRNRGPPGVPTSIQPPATTIAPAPFAASAVAADPKKS